MDQSLSDFFSRSDPANMDTCASEQIHLSGMIQNIGGTLLVDPTSLQIVGASDNLEKILGIAASRALSLNLGEVHPAMAQELAALRPEQGILHEVLDTTIGDTAVEYDVITHVHNNLRFIEFIPNEAPSAMLVRKRMRMCSKACAQIMQADDFPAARQIAVDTVREITDLDRVKIYRFLPDWSGAVDAESRVQDIPSYLGLHFPAADIPPQVRQIMEMQPCRMIGTVSDDNVPLRTILNSGTFIDQTWSMIRSVSPMHTAYLRNMDIGASFSCALRHAGKLWGLITCHSRDGRVVPVDSWNLIQEIGATLMMRLDQDHRISTANMITSLRSIENDFAAELRRDGNVEEVIASMVPVLQKFLRADGFAFQYGDKLHTAGDTPPAAFIRKLVKWAQNGVTDNDQFQTTALHRQLPEAHAHLETACGVLVQPIVVHRVCQLIWFRGPITRRVHWAGEPDSKITGQDKPNKVPGPRQSFESWIQEHRDQSLPWEPAEMESAREIFTEFLDIIASQILLKRENDTLRQFAHAAAHDIKAPLRGITHALDWMKEDGFDSNSVEAHQKIASLSATKLQKLTEALLELSLLSEQEHEFSEVPLNDVLADVHDLLAGDLKQLDAELHSTELPVIHGSQNLLTRVFLNMISNSLKYCHPDRAPRVSVAISGLEPLQISVTDNGTGIAPKFAESIFEPTKRLVRGDEVEGSGLGLSITRRMVELQGGTITLDPSFIHGARFLLEFQKRD